MLSFTVRMHFDHADHDEIAEMLRSLTAASRQEPGCVSYIAHFVTEDPATVVIYEQYTDEAALEQHRNSAHFDRYAVGGLYRLMRHRQVEHLDVIAD
jgi:quinol monooxygenase YgiN